MESSNVALARGYDGFIFPGLVTIENVRLEPIGWGEFRSIVSPYRAVSFAKTPEWSFLLRWGFRRLVIACEIPNYEGARTTPLLCRSKPMVVAPPCPGSTRVFSGSG